MSTGWRLGILGVLFVGLFSVLTLRMWQIQITEAVVYEERAESNQIKLSRTPAPRGEIRDRKGRLLAGTRPALTAVVDGQLVPKESEAGLVSSLAAFSGLAANEVQAIVDDARARGDRVAVVEDLTEEEALFLIEHPDEFPGVRVERRPIRIYPEGSLASDVIGFIGRPDQGDIDAGARPTDLLGKAGVEREYDDVLRGTEGTIKYLVDAQRNVLSVLNEQSPSPGGTLILTIDLELQAELQLDLLDGLQLARDLYDPNCVPGDEDPGCPVRAVGVVLDVTDGSVLAMASVPSYDPNIFVTGVTQEELAALPEGVFNNFAIQGQYAPASTFKAVTFITAYEADIYPREQSSPDDRILCSEQLQADFTDRSQLVWRNWTGRDDGQQNMYEAFLRSCNVYFWDVALNIWTQLKDTPDESVLQDWARNFGFGERSSIDLPFEQRGIVPDRDLFEAWAAEQLNGGPARLDPARLELASPWLGGDLLQAAVGQGSVLVTPLQLANAYAAMANGGTVWQPRVVEQVVDSNGTLVFDNPKKVLNAVDMDLRTLVNFRRALQAVVNDPRGTAAAAFADFGANKELVGGKTGTAEVIERSDDREGVSSALFAGVAPIDDPKYVVVIVIERGGSGGRVAAATAKPVLQYILNGPDAVTPILAGEDAD